MSGIINDFGVKIGGAKKDLWRMRGMLSEDLLDMTEREFKDHVNKANVWPIPNFIEMHKNGYSKLCCFYIKKVRDALPAKLIGKPTKENAESYIQFINDVRTECERTKEDSDIDTMRYRLFVSKGYLDGRSWTDKGKRQNYLQNKLIAVVILGRNARRKLEQECFIQDFPSSFRGDLRDTYVISSYDNKYRIKSYRNVAGDYQFDTQEDALEFAKNTLPLLLDEFKGSQKRKSKAGAPERPQLKSIVRNGPDLRQGKKAMPDMLLKTFEFRGGEFGNWTTQEDRQAYLNYAFDALVDMANIMKMNPKYIGLGGYEGKKLAIAFGARGAGRAVAHYEPSAVVINLTKMKGAGSLAHEWGHALDDFIGCSIGKKGMITKVDYLNSRRSEGKEKEVIDAYIKLRDTMLYRDENDEEVKYRLERQIKRYRRNLDNHISTMRRVLTGVRYGSLEKVKIANDEQIAKFDKMKESVLETGEGVEKLFDYYQELYGKVVQKNRRSEMENNARFIGYSVESYTKYKESGEVEKRNNVRSNYFEDAREIDRECAGKGYWSSEVEMFARAFESYIQDSLGFKSQYLVNGTNSSEYARFKPYPVGSERLKINKGMEEFLAVVVRCLMNGGEVNSKISKIYDEFGGNKEGNDSVVKEIKEDTNKKKEGIVLDTTKDLRDYLVKDMVPINKDTSKETIYKFIMGHLKKNGLNISESKIPYNNITGNSKAWAYVNGTIYVANNVDVGKKIEGAIESVTLIIANECIKNKVKSNMVAEGVTYKMCKQLNLDVRTYCRDNRFEKLIKENIDTSMAYKTHVENVHKVLCKSIGLKVG